MQRMSSLEIAQLTGKAHWDVLKDIDKLLLELAIPSRDFSLDVPDSQWKPRRTYNLDKRLSVWLVSWYSAKLRMAIIDRWQELESSKVPTTLSWALRLAADQAERIEQQNEIIDELQRTKSHISSSREASVMGKLSATMKQNERLQILAINAITQWSDYWERVADNRDPTYEEIYQSGVSIKYSYVRFYTQTHHCADTIRKRFPVVHWKMYQGRILRWLAVP